MDRIVGKIPTAYQALGDSHDHWLGFAQAICTTDTFPKLLSRTFKLPHSDIEYRIAGTVKGAGMIHPDMATLLGVIATDVPLSSKALKSSLTHAVDNSFNRITIDGAMSTNDTVALLASGAAGGPVIGYSGSSDPDSYSKAIYPAFREVLTDFARDLAHLVVRDGEGATKFVTISVRGAPSSSAAKEAARGIALSALVKTALYGDDANWGRIISAVGQALPLKRASMKEPKAINNVDLSFIPSDGSPELKLLINGEPEVVDEARASQVLGLEDIKIVVNLNEGKGSCTYWTCDLSPEYVRINGDYRT
jgi:glutamate N-acetyltransferase / amino-acid N-acetyltransferase